MEHRVWLKEPPTIGANYAAEVPFDGDFDARAYAARRLWRAMNGRTPGPAFHELSKQRRERLSAAIRALDARNSGGTYRSVAEALFGKKRVPDRAWKTHDLRNRTIRLVQGGLALMRGGYELSPKVGDGGNREGGISWGCLTPPLLHRRSDMPCPTITSSN
ncbi:DUF2285 domain-containing protein [Bradyrhizobium sp. 186]|uniref:DUF2285 domain-containing protein n=1 Tax=Bradyrhizobium sp. 186 TaxID=2782654 RepID=UPI003211BF4A